VPNICALVPPSHEKNLKIIICSIASENKEVKEEEGDWGHVGALLLERSQT
jgi:hypothetical protein